MPSSTAVTSFNLLPPHFRRAIHDAYDDTMETLETRYGCGRWLTYESVRMTVARHIVDQAKHGECDVERLRESALTAIHLER